jgi:predicted Rossmann fold nucleotide-binding protein DprA/Smf involved in DNA uptake
MSHHLHSGVTSRGNLDLLEKRTLALFCSARCPGNLILRSYDFARRLRDPELAVIGGFHSPMEKECLALLLRSEQPVVICPARSIENLRVPTEWREPLEDGRLLLLSPFDAGHRRTTEQTARIRNDFVASLADEVFVAHAAPESKTEAFCEEIVARGKVLLTLDSPDNAHLLALGARAIDSES